MSKWSIAPVYTETETEPEARREFSFRTGSVRDDDSLSSAAFNPGFLSHCHRFGSVRLHSEIGDIRDVVYEVGAEVVVENTSYCSIFLSLF